MFDCNNVLSSTCIAVLTSVNDEEASCKKTQMKPFCLHVYTLAFSDVWKSGVPKWKLPNTCGCCYS